MTKAYIGLGSNVGDRLGFLRDAVRGLSAADGVEVIRTSKVYETVPVGPEQPDFLNAVAEVETTVDAHELLAVLKTIEFSLGRIERERWGPREIDLDLLVFGDEEISTPELVVPHPRMTGRTFVTIPLRDLDEAAAPDIGSDGVQLFGEAELLAT